MRTDRRVRMGAMRMVANASRTACGAAAGPADIDRNGLAHLIACAAIRPDWLASVCAECRRLAEPNTAPPRGES